MLCFVAFLKISGKVDTVVYLNFTLLHIAKLKEETMQITKHICPRDCYDACGMIAHVDEYGRLVKVSGDPDHDYTQGKLCCKGYSYTQYVYHPQRLMFPMIQEPRFSGNWKRISWDDALEIIARKMIELKQRYGSLLPMALLSGPGNHGVFSKSIEFLLRSTSPFTLATGNLCISAGWDAQLLDFGGVRYKNPAEMLNTKLLLLWGVNPAATAIHQMATIQKLRAHGGRVILIDILPTATSLHCDEFIRVRPGGDGALALAILRQMIIQNSVDYSFIKDHSVGWEAFSSWLLQVDPEELYKVSGVDEHKVEMIAEQIAMLKPVSFWPGSGLQRYSNGGQNMRAIDALVAASGNIHLKDGGLYFQSIDFFQLNHQIYSSAFKTKLAEPRKVGLNALAKELGACQNPPVKVLWFTSSNYLARGTDVLSMRQQISQSELTITTDHFLTPTAEASDLVLPAVTCFEAPDLVAGYWHNKIGINQQAIQPVGECRSELAIAQSLSRMLNKLEPGMGSFPEERTPEEWFQGFSSWLKANVGTSEYRELLNGALPMLPPAQEGSEELSISTLSGKYKFLTLEALKQGCPEIPMLINPLEPPAAYPYRFLVLHRAEHLNTQFSTIDWLQADNSIEVLLNPLVAERLGIKEGAAVIIYNELGEIQMYAKLDKDISSDILVTYSWQDLFKKPVNILTKVQETDLGRSLTGFPGVAYHDTFVNLSAR